MTPFGGGWGPSPRILRRMRLASVAFLLSIALAGCPSVEVDPDETTPTEDGPQVEFDPARSIVPFPNNLVLDPATGRVNLPAQCNESATQTAIRTMVLNTLNGFGTFKSAMQVQLTEAVDAASLTDHIVLYRRATGASAVDPATAERIPVVAFPGMTARYTMDCSIMEAVDTITIVPARPLQQSSTYVVAILEGVTTASGAEFGPTFTWALVRQSANPVTIVDGVIVSDRTPLDPRDTADATSLFGLDLLWKAHARALAFLDATEGVARESILLAWEFNTQTVTDPLDPTVATSPAAMVPSAAIFGPGGSPVPVSATGAATAEQYLTGAGIPCTLGGGSLPCNAVGAILAGRLTAPSYQVDTPNALSGGDPIPGPWSDPIAPEKVRDDELEVLITIPAGTAPAGGWPTIVFGHGLASRKETMLAIVAQLSGRGFAVVAIDAVAHGSRAVQNSDAAALGCSGTPAFASAPQCFAPFLSSNLSGTRDNIRQTVLDHLTLIAALETCAATPCGSLDVDAAKIGYLGISLGGIMGGMIVAEADTLAGGVLNVPGAGWVDIFENTATAGIKCPVVDALIDAGVMTGEKWNPTAMTGTCLEEGWQLQAGYRTFANIARWVLDPADPANYAAKLATRTVLIQKVVGDLVVPNVATEQLGALSGRTPAAADPAASASPTPSAAVSTDPTSSKWVDYTNLPADGGSGFPGNTFSHSSLLRPANEGTDGLLGTVRVQTDAIAFLLANVAN
jgi:hypothetical protein